MKLSGGLEYYNKDPVQGLGTEKTTAAPELFVVLMVPGLGLGFRPEN